MESWENLMAGTIAIGRVGKSQLNFISVRADRKSPLGNPYYMAREDQRDLVCDKFAHTFPVGMKMDKNLIKEMRRIYRLLMSGKNVLLQCHCAPKRCHTETIKEFLESHIK